MSRADPFSTLPHKTQLTFRVLAAVLGGYAFCWGFMALVNAGGYALGMAFHDAEQLASILGMLVYLIVFLWAFGARRLMPVWLVLLLGGGAMAGLAWWAQARLVGLAA